MKAVQVIARGEAVFVDVEPPQLVAGHALIRPLKLSLCGSDIRMLYHSAPEAYPFPAGTTGHEMVGVVEQVDGNSALRPGDLTLTLAPGHRAMCKLYLAPLEHVLVLPSAPEDGKPLEHLLQAQQYGTVIYACRRLPNVTGADVAVIGQGSAGMWFSFQLRRMGARRIIAIDLDERRLALSARFGATDVIHNVASSALPQLAELTGGRLVDLVVEAAGEEESINLAVDLVRKNGRILFFGYPRGQRLLFDFEQFFHKCCDATTIVGVSEEPDLVSTRMALEAIARGEIDVSPLITHTFPFERVIEAYELHRTRGDGAVKIVIEVGE
jgi:L-iditol 2-dehydrogenase